MARKKIGLTSNAIVEGSVDGPQVLTSRGRTLVFTSHDSRDADLAEAFANLLSDVSAGTLKSFRSSDKEKGVRDNVLPIGVIKKLSPTHFSTIRSKRTSLFAARLINSVARS